MDQALPLRALAGIAAVAVVLSASLFANGAARADANGPRWTAGDYWVYSRTSDNQTTRYDVVGPETVALSQAYAAFHLRKSVTTTSGSTDVTVTTDEWIREGDLAIVKSVAVVIATQTVTFDPPLDVNFTVPSGAAYGSYAGRTIVLQYNGFGDLHGIPGKCVSLASNAPVSCETAGARYVPEFIVPFDQTLGTVTRGSTTYLVKWLDREIRLAKKDVSVCSGAGLSLPSGVALPTSASLKDPSNASSDVYVGTKPIVTSAPRVIHGEVKY